MNLQPIGTKILVELEKPERKTKGGIIISDAAQCRSQYGKVIAVGSGINLADGKKSAIKVNVGDTVACAKFAGYVLKEYSEEILLIDIVDILAIAEKG